MENKTERKDRAERLKRLSAQGMSLEDLIRHVMSADMQPFWEEEKAKRKTKEREKAKKENGKGGK